MALSSDTNSDRSDVSPPLTVIPLGDLPRDSTVRTTIDTNTTCNLMNPSEANTPPLTAITLGDRSHDSTAPTIVDTVTTCDPTNPSEDDTNDHEEVQEPVVDAQDDNTSPVQGMKVKDQENKKARLVEWASALTIKDVVLTKEGLDVETLGVWKWSELKCYVKQAFLQANKIAIAQAH